MKIAWVTSGPLERIATGLTSSLASARYRILIPAAELAARGVQCKFIGVDDLRRGEIALPTDLDAIVISKSSHGFTETLAQEARTHGAAVVVDFCDDYFSEPDMGPHHLRLAALADQIVVSASALADVVQRQTQQSPPRVINDPCEGPRGAPRFNINGDEPLHLLWYGHPRNLETLAETVPDLSASAHTMPMDLTIVTNVESPAIESLKPFITKGSHALKIALKPWSLETTWSELERCDMVVIPSSERQKYLIKGSNRLAEALWAGRCVAAYPLQSYQEFAAWSFLDTEICSAIERAVDEADAVPARIAAAQTYLAQHYSPAVIAAQWLEAIETAMRLRRDHPKATGPTPARTIAPLRLNLGCGDKHLPDYVNVDVVDERLAVKPDVVCDVRQLTAFKNDSADEILSVHVVEHLWRWEVVDVLKEWVRVLKPGATMILECPNLISACEEFLRNPRQASGPGPEGQRTMWVFYGDPRWRDPLMVHRWGYTPESLADVMREAGLVNVRQEPAQFKLREPRDMRVVGEKPQR